MPLLDFLRRLTGSSEKEFYCPVCRTTSEAFLSFGVIPRENAMCPHCSALERHRLLWLYLEQKTSLFHDNLRMLDVAPHASLQQKFRTMKNLDYISVDPSSLLAMHKMDLIHLKFPDNSFDCILCYHVLEHIPEDHTALREIWRVLRPGGWAIIQSPVDYNLMETYEDFSVTDPVFREKHFKQWDKVRIYGRDYPQRLKNAGFSLTVSSFAKELGPHMIRRCALRKTELLHVCCKPI